MKATKLESNTACVYYDGACALCNREISALKATNGDLDFVNVHDAEALPYAKEQMLMHLHAISADGEVLTGLDANIYMWRQCEKRWLARFMAFAPVYFFAKPIYNLWAKRRYSKLYTN